MTSKILENIHSSVKGLHKAGIVDLVTMREFDELCLPKVPKLSAKQIKQLRAREKVSQPVFAGFLNVSPSAIKQWENGEKSPSGAALKLLHVVKHNGLSTLQL